MSEDNAIVLDGLHKSYGDVRAVDGISFAVRRGEIFGMVGPNGAGKTTTIECLEGLRKPSSGRVSVLGLDPDRQGYELRERIGVQLQQSALPDRLKVREILDLFAAFYPKIRSLASASRRVRPGREIRRRPSASSPAGRSSGSSSPWPFSTIRRSSFSTS